MFLRDLNQEEKKAFLSLAFKIIKCDGCLAQEEKERIEEIRVETGLFTETELMDKSIEELVNIFSSKESKKSALIEAVRLAYIDGEYDNQEQKILRAMALGFGFNEKEAMEIENWVLDLNKLIEKGKEIIRSN